MTANPTPADTWARAVDLGARGQYAEAQSLAGALGAYGGRWSSLASSLLGSHLRQIGQPHAARLLDVDALTLAVDAETRAEALIGLAADAVSAGDAATAAARHAQAEEDSRASWRTRVRWHWVGAELGMLAGDRAKATGHAQEAGEVAAGISARHDAKSRIVLAAVTGDTSRLPDVSPILRAHDWVTLEWPLALVAADHPGVLPADWITSAWSVGRGATYVIEEGLPLDRHPAWRGHPGVRRLRAGGPPAGGE